jgi:hypothetical protein
VRVAAPIEKVDGRAQELKEVEAVEVVDKEREAEVGPSRRVENPSSSWLRGSRGMALRP